MLGSVRVQIREVKQEQRCKDMEFHTLMVAVLLEVKPTIFEVR